jgi:hypothetical protein
MPAFSGMTKLPAQPLSLRSDACTKASATGPAFLRANSMLVTFSCICSCWH